VDHASDSSADHRRVAPRTFLMLAATLSCGAAIYQVRIRNVSETGALIEGADLPVAGEEILLSRGETEIDAIVAWASGSRRGVHFSRPVAVDTWRAGKAANALPASQGRVDLIQAAARSGRNAASLPPPPPEERWIDELDARMAEELAFVQRLVETLGDELVADPAIVHRHTQALQNIDVASQVLGYLSRVIGAPDRADAVRDIGMEDLRARLTRHSALP
jgi:hypothetical protein